MLDVFMLAGPDENHFEALKRACWSNLRTSDVYSDLCVGTDKASENWKWITMDNHLLSWQGRGVSSMGVLE